LTAYSKDHHATDYVIFSAEDMMFCNKPTETGQTAKANVVAWLEKAT